MAEEEEGVGACYDFSAEGVSEEEVDVIYDLVEMTNLCSAGRLWVVANVEVLSRVWYGRTPERALAAYLGERLRDEEEYLERLPGECESKLEQAREARGRGDLRGAEWFEREYRYCLEDLEEQRRKVQLLRSAVEGLRAGRIKLKLKRMSEP